MSKAGFIVGDILKILNIKAFRSFPRSRNMKTDALR
jgi:hypothetical protein